jgi:hypothetical protein
MGPVQVSSGSLLCGPSEYVRSVRKEEGSLSLSRISSKRKKKQLGRAFPQKKKKSWAEHGIRQCDASREGSRRRRLM